MNIKFPGDTYDVIHYPGGEIETRFKKEFWVELRDSPKLTIDARLTSVQDIFTLLCLSDSVRNLRAGLDLSLRMPYVPFARNDRRFVDGGSYGLKIFGEVIRQGMFDRYIGLDVHNYDRAFLRIGHAFQNVEPTHLIEKAVADFTDRFGNPTILFPDLGAQKRYKMPTYRCLSAMKERDPQTGQLIRFIIPPVVGEWNCLIVDDLCDGGGTFVGIAELLRQQGFKGKLGLYVTHGIFSQGVGTVAQYFDHVYTTNSFQTFSLTSTESEHFTVYDAWEALEGKQGQ